MIEELFHAYQHDNRNNYQEGKFNREFEAKILKFIILYETYPSLLVKGTTDLTEKKMKYEYGDISQTMLITPHMVKSKLLSTAILLLLINLLK